MAAARQARTAKSSSRLQVSRPRLKVNVPLFLSITHLKDKLIKICQFHQNQQSTLFICALQILISAKLKTKVMARTSRMRTMFLIPFTSIIFILGWLSLCTGSTNSNKKRPKITSRNHALVKQPLKNNTDSQLLSLERVPDSHQMIFSILPRK